MIGLNLFSPAAIRSETFFGMGMDQFSKGVTFIRTLSERPSKPGRIFRRTGLNPR